MRNIVSCLGHQQFQAAAHAVIQMGMLDTNEDAPMLDVHPPHASTHSWRDFWIHLGTITAGLLIAIWLEQSVEGLHHLRERHRLEADLRDETQKSKEMVERDFRFLDIAMRTDMDLKNYLDQMRMSHSRFPEPAQLAEDRAARAKATLGTIFLLSTASWNTARENQLVVLLPPAEAETYSRLYVLVETEHTHYYSYFDAQMKLADFANQFNDWRARNQPDYARMTDEDLREYSRLLATSFTHTRDLKRFLKYFYGSANAVLDGAGSADDLIKAQFEAESTIKDDLGPEPEMPQQKALHP
jgi:hypothetical protein